MFCDSASISFIVFSEFHWPDEMLKVEPKNNKKANICHEALPSMGISQGSIEVSIIGMIFWYQSLIRRM